ncbi:alpha,alpha-trehalose phosphorylase [Sphingomonas kyeonggiensis]|uniref:Alpha,alpha-trehalose phosphorylase n=1 Tax=Sphingomonas kyeonggiensis TaxID=1268553 RepID=A0A7W7NSF6_9SPHN|nr:glycoside hydrolase family 65 protein [Sphingomonas kyeonggiensis]MBB4839898.1 alpha,alpha-trehalose phosphorylase [Sphingomonas kyeonggiensis]
MARVLNGADDGVLFAEDGWSLDVIGDDPAREGWAATILALSNGALGVRGAIEERAEATTFLAHAYEQAPIHYHEKLKGFAASSDSRVPVAEALGLEVRINGEAIDFRTLRSATRRTLDLRAGMLRRETRWSFPDGRLLRIRSERIVPLDGSTLLLRRFQAEIDGEAGVTLHPRLAPAPSGAAQSDDPRIGVNLASRGFETEQASDEQVVERLPGSGIGVAAVQRIGEEDGWLLVATGFAAGRDASETLVADAGALAGTALAEGFVVAAATQAALLDRFWAAADLSIAGEPRLAATLRANLFHLFASAGRDGRSSAAAKGLTGEGYEGHYFWDTEAFMLPVLSVLAPEIARAMLVYRAGTLDAAFANARALDHKQGALYAWRTIEGRECSAHYPSGSAQYHINSAIAFAIGAYVDATGDEGFLVEHGVRMLVETARIWLALGDWADGSFHLRGVTGPDEYTALVDDNWYTNRMAQKHLRLAVSAADRVSAIDPEAWGWLAAEMQLGVEELAEFTRVADAMHLPFDAERNLDAQDASFLDKPRWDVAGTPASEFPLLLNYHPMTLYRHQVSKQADIVLAMVLGGEDISAERKRRVFDHYEPITTHDSTLSASTFAILASEVGHEAQALDFFAETSLVDIDDRHGNTGHGVHMAALAGSWLALVWGFAGFRPHGPQLRFRPTRPAAWPGYSFGLNWRGTLVRVEVAGEQITYRAVSGPEIVIGHHDTKVLLAPGESWTGPLA